MSCLVRDEQVRMYYEMNYECVMRKVKAYSVYDDSGKLLSYRGEVQ